MKILVTGGVKSGKSRYALRLASERFCGQKTFLATAVALDGEMSERIRRHQHERGSSYTTVEEPIEIHNHTTENLILDCVTLWMNNLFYHGRQDEWEEILRLFMQRLGENAVVVTNEVGWGNIPESAQVRRYNDLLGTANRVLAEGLDEVYLMAAGIPIRIK